MASRLMHYIISHEIMKETSFDKDLFLLGNLAPDAHDGSLYGNSHAHFRKIIGNEYDSYPNIDLERFKEQYLNKKNNIDDFIIGYYCHLVSDANWVNSIYPKYLKYDLDIDEARYQRELLFNDLRIFNTLLREYFNVDFQNDIILPVKFGISEFSHNKLILLLNALSNDMTDNYDGNLEIFNFEFILDYIKVTISKCINELRP